MALLTVTSLCQRRAWHWGAGIARESESAVPATEGGVTRQWSSGLCPHAGVLRGQPEAQAPLKTSPPSQEGRRGGRRGLESRVP